MDYRDNIAHGLSVKRKALEMSYRDLTDDDVRQGHIGDGLLRIMMISLSGAVIALIGVLSGYIG